MRNSCIKDPEKIKQHRKNFEEKLKEVRPALTVVDFSIKNHKRKVTVRCNNGHQWTVPEGGKLLNLKRIENQCPYCSGLIKELKGNSLGDKRPDLIKYFVDKNEAFNYFPRSMKRVKTKCPSCGEEKEYAIDTLSTRGFSCECCNFDGISQPNKMIRSVLKQFREDFNFLKFEYKPEWLTPQSFDAYFIINGKQIAVEMQGPQHYEKPFYWNEEQFQNQLERDSNKRKLCKENNCIMIEIKCVKNDLTDIQTQILNSKLNEYIDTANINWNLSFKETGEKILETITNLYKEGLTPNEISDKLDLCYPTVVKYLLIGDKSSMIKFSTRSRTKSVKIVNVITGEVQITTQIREAVKYIYNKYNLTINPSTISEHCKRNEKQIAFQKTFKFYWV